MQSAIIYHIPRQKQKTMTIWLPVPNLTKHFPDKVLAYG